MRTGFTLLELLIVVFLLSMVALSAASFLAEVDDQLRYEDSQARISAVREAVLGRSLSAEGRPVLSGFVSDIGRLPDSLAELLRPGPLPVYGLDAGTGLAAGWRGPYLDVLPELSSGLRQLRDGWGGVLLWNQAGAGLASSLRVQSQGGSEGIYAQRFPPDGQWLIQPADYSLAADTLRLWLWNSSGVDSDFSALGDSLRVELAAPRDGRVVADFARSEPVAIPAGLVAHGHARVVQLVFPTDLRLPLGRCSWRPTDAAGVPWASFSPVLVLPRSQPLELRWELR